MERQRAEYAVRALAAAGALAAALASAGPCYAAPARLSAALGFSGIVVPGRWNPLWARCDGAEGEVRIEVVLRSEDGSAIGAESFPCRDGLRVECPVMVDERLRSISVRLVSSGEILAEEKIEARSRLFPGHVVLVCGERIEAELAISAALFPSEPVQAVSTSLADLPSLGLDYDAVSAVALRDPGRAVAPAQRDAMAAWLAGGGRLAVTEPRAVGESVVGSLVGALASRTGASDALPAILPFGLGAIAVLREAPYGEGAGDAERAWKAALALSPYDRSERLTASRAFKTPALSFSKGPEAARAELVILIALALWAGVAVIASRNRRKSLIPVAAAAAASLAFALAGAAGLDAMLMRGARVSARAVVLPDEGFALASIGVRTSFGDSLREFQSIKAVRPLKVGYRALEGGLMGAAASAAGATASAGAFEWSHALPRPSLSLRSWSRDSLDLAGVLEPGVLEGSGIPDGALSSARSRELPELESAGPLALAGALAQAGGGGPQWLVRKQGRWIEEQFAPSWIGPDAAWIDSLKALAPGRSFLVGKCSAPAMRLAVGGSAATELLWAMPVAARTLRPGGEARP
jgi:hypothetical protein